MNADMSLRVSAAVAIGLLVLFIFLWTSRYRDVRTMSGGESDRERAARLRREAGFLLSIDRMRSIDTYRECFEIASNIPDLDLASDCLRELGAIYEMDGFYSLARKFYLDSISLEQPSGHLSNAAEMLSRVGITYVSEGDYKQSVQWFRAAIEARENSPKDDKLASDLTNLAETYWRLGLTSEALPYYERAAEQCTKHGQWQRLETLLSRIGRVYTMLGNHERALDIWRQELELARRDGRPMRVVHALSMVSEGYRRAKDPVNARRHYDEMVGIFRSSPAHPPIGVVSLTPADALGEMEQIALDVSVRADEHGELEVQREAWLWLLHACEAERDLTRVATTFQRIAKTYESVGAIEEARTWYERILDLGEECGERSLRWSALMDMAQLWHSVFDYDRMLECCSRAKGEVVKEIEHRSSQAVFPTEYEVFLQYSLATILASLGYVNEMIGKRYEMDGDTDGAHDKYDEALENVMRALAITRRELEDKVAETIGARGEHTIRALRELLPELLNLAGGVYHALGNYDQALSYYGEAGEGFRGTQQPREVETVLFNIALVHLERGEFAAAEDRFEALIREHGQRAVYLANRGRTRLGQGKLAAAWKDFKRSLRMAEDWRGKITGRAESRSTFFEGWSPIYSDAVTVCLRLAANAMTPIEAERWHRRAWNLVHRSRSRTLLELLASAKPRLNSARGHELWERFKHLERELASIETEHEGSTLRMGKRGTTLRSQQDVKRDYEDAREEILRTIEGSRTLLTVEVPPPKKVVHYLKELACSGGNLDSRTLFVEFFVVSEVDVVVFLLPLWKEMVPVVERLTLGHRALRCMTETAWKAGETRQSRAQRTDRNMVASAGHLEVFDDEFERLPAEMSALIQPWAHRLEEWQPTQLLISPHFLINLLPLHAALWRGRSLIDHFAVVYLPSPALAVEIVKRRSTSPSDALLLGNPTGDLENAEDEVVAVANQMERVGLNARMFLREHATTERFETHASSAAIIHLACHSSLNTGAFLRSGMDLADGRLTALDVMARVNLERATLCYLSSCDSCRAIPGRTDELMALVRVFFYSGSPTVIATLWPLDSPAGETFANNFYKFWLGEREPLAKAFQKAMQETRKSHSRASHWAPFVLMGAYS